MASYEAGYGVGNAISGHDPKVISFSFISWTKEGVLMKKVSYSMAAMNRKQCILCIIMTDRLRLIRYIELGENSVPIARSFESPITGKLLAYVWKVESSKWVEWLFWTLWRTVCYDKETEAHIDELLRLGWLKVNQEET